MNSANQTLAGITGCIPNLIKYFFVCFPFWDMRMIIFWAMRKLVIESFCISKYTKPVRR